MIEFDFDSRAWSMATMFNFWPQGNVRFVSESDKVTKKRILFSSICQNIEIVIVPTTKSGRVVQLPEFHEK